MKYEKIEVEDPILLLDTDFVKKYQKIEGFSFDNIKDYGVHAIPMKKELNDKADFKIIGDDTIYFIQGDNKLNEFAYQLHKAISGEIKICTNQNAEKAYRLEYNISRKGNVYERLHGYVTADKLIALCKALYSKKVAR